MIPNLQSFGDRTSLMQAVAGELARAASDVIGARGEACIALSGGSTPAPAYEALAKSPLAKSPMDWAKTTFILVDERFVPSSDAASNEGLLRRTLAPALAAGARLVPMFTPDATLDDAAARADVLYARLRIDVAVMGMGEDAHTASWFPDADRLREALDLSNARTVIALNAPGAGGACERLSLTRAAVARASQVLLVLTGAAKRARLEAALIQKAATAPVAALFAAGPAPRVLWAP
jgi:6-phosphogluconolactonase